MDLKQAALRHLEDSIIPFWVKLRDDERGGFIGYVGHDLTPDPAAPRGCIQNSRILWFFASAYLQFKQPVLLDCAKHACQAMMRFADPVNGGLYWLCAADGTPLDTTKHTYNHAFAIYALAAYAQASGDDDALARALAYFELIETRMTEDGQYLDAFTADFMPLSNDKLSDNPVLTARGVIAEKTMNTMLHVMEAYTLLYTVSNDTRVRERLIALLELIRTKVYHPANNRMDVFFDKNMHSLIDMQSYGHDIEASWLWDLAADAVLTGDELARVQQMNTRLARGVLQRALTEQGLLNECVEGADDSMRIWWVQAEAMVGMVNLWQKTGDAALTQDIQALWAYIQANIVDDRPGGEWFAEVDERGKPRTLPIADPWKAPYHNGRMCLELIKRL